MYFLSCKTTVAAAYFSVFLTLALIGNYFGRNILYLSANILREFSIVRLAWGKTLVKYLLS